MLLRDQIYRMMPESKYALTLSLNALKQESTKQLSVGGTLNEQFN